MKVRSSFVTNSSSSNYMIALKFNDYGDVAGVGGIAQGLYDIFVRELLTDAITINSRNKLVSFFEEERGIIIDENYDDDYILSKFNTLLMLLDEGNVLICKELDHSEDVYLIDTIDFLEENDVIARVRDV